MQKYMDEGGCAYFRQTNASSSQAFVISYKTSILRRYNFKYKAFINLKRGIKNVQ